MRIHLKCYIFPRQLILQGFYEKHAGVVHSCHSTTKDTDPHTTDGHRQLREEVVVEGSVPVDLCAQ